MILVVGYDLSVLSEAWKPALVVMSSYTNDVGLRDFFLLCFTRIFLTNWFISIGNTTFKDEFQINFYEPVYYIDFQWLLDSPIIFLPLVWQNSSWFSIFCMLYWKYEKYSLLINKSDWLYFFMLIISKTITFNILSTK